MPTSPASPTASSASATLATLRRWLLALLVLGFLGTATELLLAKHTEDPWQLTPLALIGLALVVLGASAPWRSRAALVTFQGLMLLFVLSGGVGSYLHYRAKAEFALERHADLAGLALAREALKGTNPPLLAPGAMIALGLLGLAWTYRHPALDRAADTRTDTTGVPA